MVDIQSANEKSILEKISNIKSIKTSINLLDEGGKVSNFLDNEIFEKKFILLFITFINFYLSSYLYNYIRLVHINFKNINCKLIYDKFYR